MKKTYETPEWEIVRIIPSDIINNSAIGEGGGQTGDEGGEGGGGFGEE